MRKDEFFVDDYVHVYNRGNRKQVIVRDDRDRWHFLQMLYYFNNKTSVESPFQDLHQKLKSDFYSCLVWPAEWRPQEPLVRILAFTLMDNHFHLLLKEITEGGITSFMRKLGTGMTNYFNVKYEESGRLFQGAYKAKRVDDEGYLMNLSAYIHVKNTFELYPKGFAFAAKNFSDAYEWAAHYPYTSLANYAHEKDSAILHKDILGELVESPRVYRDFCKECLEVVLEEEDSINHLAFEENE